MEKAKARYGSRANLPTSGMEAGELLWTVDRGTMWASTGPTSRVPIVPEVDALVELTSGSVDLAADLLLVHDASATGQKEKRLLLSQLLLSAFASAALTGNPTAPTQAPGNSSTRIATTSFVQAALAALVNSSPAALDTLNELATALGNDPNFATTVTNALAGKQPLDATLTALAAVTVAADQLMYSTGPDTFATTALTALARTLLAASTTSAARAAIGAAGSILEASVAPTLLNSWAEYAGGFQAPGYYKDGFGIVRLTGVVKSGAIGSTIFTLPAGYRPGSDMQFPVASNGYGSCRVRPDGSVIAFAGSTTWYSLDGVAFRTA